MSDEKLESLFGGAVYTYTRAQAIDDGVLIDVSEPAKEAGFKIPVAISQAAYEKYVEWTEEDTKRHEAYQDVSGRLWDVLYMLHVAISTGVNKVASKRHSVAPNAVGETVHYKFLCIPRDLSNHTEAQEYELKAHIGPGDNYEPVITIMLPGED